MVFVVVQKLATRIFLENLEDGHALVKLDICNAFNSVCRDKMLETFQVLAPMIYPLVHSVYSAPSTLLWENHTIMSSEGLQQGVTLGSLLVCLVL